MNTAHKTLFFFCTATATPNPHTLLTIIQQRTTRQYHRHLYLLVHHQQFLPVPRQRNPPQRQSTLVVVSIISGQYFPLNRSHCAIHSSSHYLSGLGISSYSSSSSLSNSLFRISSNNYLSDLSACETYTRQQRRYQGPPFKSFHILTPLLRFLGNTNETASLDPPWISRLKGMSSQPLRSPPPAPNSQPTKGPARNARVLGHINDLKQSIANEAPNPSISIKALMILAEKRWMAAITNIEFGRDDLAFVDFNVGINILVSLIPKHKEWPTFSNHKQNDADKYRSLRTKMYEKISFFEEVKEKILQDNAKNNTLPKGKADQAALRNGNSHHRASLSIDGSSSSTKEPNGNLTNMGPPKKKPPPPPPTKPDSLKNFHNPETDGRRSSDGKSSSRPQSRDGGATDLHARFQALRLGNGAGKGAPLTVADQIRLKTGGGGGRDNSNGISLSTDQPMMPKPPSPTYSPVRQYSTTPFGSVSSGPRPLVRTSSSLSQYSETAASSASVPVTSSNAQAMMGLEEKDGSTVKTNGVSQKAASSKESQVTAERLSEYLSRSAEISLLIIDVRDRSDFDEGHIFAKNIICIEPIVLREGITSTELEDSLSISPEKELQLFIKRETFDIIVFHDKSTTNLRHLGGPHKDPTQKVLQSLVQAIHEFEYSKPLKSPPQLLVGGIDAWIEYNGPTSLVPTTHSEKAVGHKRLNRSNAISSGLAQRRKLRQHIPGQVILDEKEDLNVTIPPNQSNEDEWVQRIEDDNDTYTISPPGLERDDRRRRRTTSIVSSSSVQFEHPRNIEEFFKRFPSLPQLESMTTPPPMPQHAPPPPPIDSPYSATSEHQNGGDMYESQYYQESPQHTGTDDSASSPSLQRRNTIIDHMFHGFTDVRNPAFNPPASPSRPAPVVPRKSYSGVSERHQPPPPLLDDQIKSLGPSQPIPPSGTFQTTRIGLKNLGNTCYMNSIIQCMSGTVPLARYFLGGDYKHHINRHNPLGSRGRFADEFANLNRTLWDGNLRFTSPNTFKDLSGRLNDQFHGTEQQDAQEYLDFLLDMLHEDLNPHAGRPKFPPLTDQEERTREKMPVQLASYYEWMRYVQTNQSVIVDWFQGQYRSRLRCLTCGFTSTTYSPFMYLSLPIPAVKGGPCTLMDCMNEFTKEEVLEGDDAWHCPNCKQSRKATKKLSISRMPFVLIIHLKRFSSHGRWRDKINNLVTFGLDLDLTSYVPPLMDDMPPYKAPPVTTQARPPFHYQLYAVANHYGSLTSGHYTAFVKDTQSSTWHKYDDSRVSSLDPGDIVSKGAYVLFWVRKNVM